MYDTDMGKRAVLRHMKQPEKVPFTRAGFEQLGVRRAELLIKREEVLIALQRAREMGDLSENGAYTAARFELGNTDRELKRLEFMLKYGQVVEVKGTEKIGFGNKVTVGIGDKEYVYTLVGTQEADPKKAMISLESPIGIALLGKRVGETATVTMSDRVIEYRVKKIE